MEEEILYYKEFVSQFPKLKIKEFECLLKEKTIDAKNTFLNGFMHYIYRRAVKLYYLNEEYFNAYYDFEELFNDGIIIATELFLSDNINYTSFNIYLKYFMTLYSYQLVKTYFMKANPSKWHNIKRVLELKNANLSIDEIKQVMNDCTKSLIKKVKSCEYLNDNLMDNDFEDRLIDELEEKSMIKDINNVLQELSFPEYEIVCCIYGLGDHDKMTKAELAKNYCISRQAISNKYSRILRKIRISNPQLIKHLR